MSVADVTDTFLSKAKETGKTVPDVDANTLITFNPSGCDNTSTAHSRRPPRLVSDKLVNVFFQEINPLFPILRRPSFLEIYSDFVSGSDNIENHQAVAQLNLVFSIAATASGVSFTSSSPSKAGPHADLE